MLNIDCEKIGENNRFGELKAMNCLDYFQSEHKKEFNPNFNDNDFCKICNKVLDYIVEISDALSELAMALEPDYPINETFGLDGE